MISIRFLDVLAKLKVMIMYILGVVKNIIKGRRFIVVTIVECFMLFWSIKFSILTISSLSCFNRGIELHMQLLWMLLAISSILISTLLYLINTKEGYEIKQDTIRVDNIRDVVVR